MTPNEYQELAIRTATNVTEGRERLANWALGLAGESGEAADVVKKCLFHGHVLDTTKLVKELGDVLWYVAVLANEIAYPLEEVMDLNIAKLMARYPDGFDPARSRNRIEEAVSNG
jgi:NTP pyrophosphatase (non-canonical NTP hydrolase)